MSGHIICESIAAIVTHVRRIAGTEPSYSGHAIRPLALCGASIAWDTKLPLSTASCRTCRDLFAKESK